MNCMRCGHAGDFSAYRGTCPLCGGALAGGTAPFPGSMYRDMIPWEAENSALSPLKALCLTLIRSVTARDRFFAAAARTTPLAAPFIYALLMGSIGTLATFFWESSTPLSISSLFSGSGTFSGIPGTLSPFTLIATPFALTIQLFMLTVYCHGMLLISRSRKKPLAATFKTVCYVQSAALFQIIPFAGIFLSFLVGAFLLMEGICSAHGISRTRFFAALLLPLAMVLSLSAAGIVLLLSIMALSAGNAFDLFSLFRR
ncbi:MAG: hypothetical protein JXA71_10265 [Chitinispirillaceae bacterium]|nr:hypothetical protein [Chitinispirillaceae bacterium]